MIKEFGQRSVISYYKFISRFGNRPAPVSIFEQIKDANNVLLCLPNDMQKLSGIVSFDSFRQVFPNAKITLLYNADTIQNNGFPKGFKRIFYQKAQLSTLGMPPKSLRLDILREKYDIAIDLSLEYNYINTSVIWESKACLRIGFNHPMRDDLYNFLIRVKTGETPENTYNSLFRYLGAGTIKTT